MAAIVSSLALTWGVAEVAGKKRSEGRGTFAAKWLYGVYAACVGGSATVVWAVPDLVRLNIAAQVLNAFLLPLMIGFLVVLAVKSLPEPVRLRGRYLRLIVGIALAVSVIGLLGGVLGSL